MKLTKRIKLMTHILRWRFSWSKKDLDFLPVGARSGKFITARQAAALIPDGSCVFSNGFGGSARCSVFFWAIREAFLNSGHPAGLCWINVAAQGGRGKVPGTVEELGLPGLMDTYITGHHETAKAQLKLAEAGLLELHTMPQGVMDMLLDAQSRGETHYLSEVGLRTFVDPRIGAGSRVTEDAKDQLVAVEGKYLKYTLPKIDVALFNAPYADVEGNLYFKHASTLTENIPSARAARANDGLVIATVSGLIPREESSISMSADEVDYIVVHPYNEQIVGVRQQKYWPIFTPEGKEEKGTSMENLNFINRVLKITPQRNEVDRMLARLAASLLVAVVPKGAMANIGVGYPEEVVKILMEQGMEKDLLFTTEAGAYGGIPPPGIFFGAALQPHKLISSLEMFRLYQKELEVAVLGFLQVDSQGNVNASRRGPHLTDFVGPGGFPDIIDGAKTVIFIGSWMAKADYRIEEGQLKLVRPGIPKFVDRVDQITFSAREGLRKGKQVYYVTHGGVFKLSTQGLRLIRRIPGIDIQKNLIDHCPARFYIPDPENIPMAAASILSGEGFQLRWAAEQPSVSGVVNADLLS